MGCAVETRALAGCGGETFILTGLNTTPAMGRPCSTTAAQMVKCGRPFMKATVPSIGIDHKDARGVQPGRIVHAFLRQPAIIGPRRQQFRL